MSTVSTPLDALPEAALHGVGIYKYIVLEASLGDASRILVRGRDLPYHADILDAERRLLDPVARAAGVRLRCTGGGRVKRAEGSILVYGYSMAFGRGDHAHAVELLQRAYPGEACTFSSDPELY